MIAYLSSPLLWEIGTDFPQSQPLVKDCQFGVSPVNYSDSDWPLKKAITCIPLSEFRGQLPLARHTNDSNFNKFDATLTELSVHWPIVCVYLFICCSCCSLLLFFSDLPRHECIRIIRHRWLARRTTYRSWTNKSVVLKLQYLPFIAITELYYHMETEL